MYIGKELKIRIFDVNILNYIDAALIREVLLSKESSCKDWNKYDNSNKPKLKERTIH